LGAKKCRFKASHTLNPKIADEEEAVEELCTHDRRRENGILTMSEYSKLYLDLLP
jgi:hypothetical protein